MSSSATPGPEPEHRAIPTVWVGLDETQVSFANAFVCQFQPGEFVISIGQVVPPMLLGPPEAHREQLEAVDFVPITPIARIAVTRDRLVELINALQENLRNHDVATGAQG